LKKEEHVMIVYLYKQIKKSPSSSSFVFIFAQYILMNTIANYTLPWHVGHLTLHCVFLCTMQTAH